MKKVQINSILTYGFWLLMFCLSINVLRIAAPRLKADAENITPARAILEATGLQAKYAPYTAQIKMASYDPKGVATQPQSAETTLTLAVRSDGARAMLFQRTDPVHPLSQGEVDLPSHQQILIDHLRGTKSTYQLVNYSPDKILRDPSKNCVTSVSGAPVMSGEKFKALEDVAGYRTAKVARDNVTSWYAIDFGCAELKSKLLRDDGSYSENTVVALTSGEPSATLFSAPPAFKEVPPSQLHATASSNPVAAKARDDTYHAHQMQ